MSCIPNHFHFVFGLKPQTQPFHLMHYLCLESCIQVNRPDLVSFHYQCKPYGRYWDLIKEKLALVKVEPVEFVAGFRYPKRSFNQYRYAHHSDFIRLEKLLAHGGVYADIDTLFVQPIPDDLCCKPFVLGQEADIFDPALGAFSHSLCNAFIIAQTGAAFGRLWLEQMQAGFDGTWSNHSTLLPYHLSQAYPDLVHIEPRQTFYKHGCTPQDLHTLLEGCDPDFTGVVSMHLWSHLWWSWRRLDFTTFHAGRLTEDYVRNVDTTYNLIARRFLPPPMSNRHWWHFTRSGRS